MKCPILSHKNYIESEWPSQVYEDCLEEECAWWDKEQECCVICTIAGELDALHYFAKSIRDKMPVARE